MTYDLAGSGDGIVVDGYGNRTNTDTAPFAADNIAILLDGQCSSTCTIFANMAHQVGIRTVVAGGLPAYGPMQAVAGVRGSQAYAQETLNSDITGAISVDQSLAAQLPAPLDYYQIVKASFNLRDTINQGSEIPWQFQYQAADCRIFYTKDNFANFTNLWKDAANAVFNDSSLCVQGSTGQPSAGNGNATSTGPTISFNQTKIISQANEPSPSSTKAASAANALGIASSSMISAILGTILLL